MSRRSHRRAKDRRKTKLLEFLEGRTLLASPLVITRGGTYSGTWESTNRALWIQEKLKLSTCRAAK